MPKYFFHTIDGRRYPDEQGSELPDMAAVRKKATLIIGELLKEQPSELWDTGRLRLEVVDQKGDRVLALEVSLEGEIAA